MNLARIPMKPEMTEENLHGFFFEADWDVTALLDYDEKIDRPYEIVWANYERDTVVHYIDDHAIGVRYLVIDGNEKENIEKDLRAEFDFYNCDELLEAVHDAKEIDDLLHAFSLLAIVATSQVDVEIFQVFENLLAHENAEVRRITLFTLAYIGWPEFKSTIEHLAAKDEDPRVRERAAILLEGYNMKEQGKLGEY